MNEPNRCSELSTEAQTFLYNLRAALIELESAQKLCPDATNLDRVIEKIDLNLEFIFRFYGIGEGMEVRN